MNKLAIFDFDHLLFRSDEFWQAILISVSKRFGIDANRFDAERLDRSATGLGRVAGGEGYDLFVHLAAHGIGHEEAKAGLLADLRGDGWLYPGAVELITYLQDHGYQVVIMSVGAVKFQIEIKRDACSNLPPLPFRAVMANKGGMLGGEFDDAGALVYDGVTYDVVVVIDDCGATFDEMGKRAGVTCIQVTDRPKYPQASPHDWVAKVTELEQIQPLIAALDATL